MTFNFDDDNDNNAQSDDQQFSDDTFGAQDFYAEDTREQGAPPEESGNRTFVIVAIVLGALIVLTMICIGIFAATQILPTMTAARLNQATQDALNVATQQQEMINQSLTQTANVPTATEGLPATFTPTPLLAATKTPVLAATATPTRDVIGAETATVIALKTKLAEAQLTKLPTATALPQGGFADEVGAPGLVGLAIVLVVVIFLARRMRSG
jgi:type II secretory pathway pseudopilin PulG